MTMASKNMISLIITYQQIRPEALNKMDLTLARGIDYLSNIIPTKEV